MRKIAVYLLISLASCNKQKLNDKAINQTNLHLIKKDSINGNEYILYFKENKSIASKDDHFTIDSLIITKNNTKYVLNLKKHKIKLTDYELSDVIYTNDDYNFDGIKDIMLYPHLENYSVYGNDYRAFFYIYNKRNDKYENKTELDSIPNLDICKKNKYLFSIDGNYFRKYRWEGNLLKEFENIEEIKLDDGQYLIRKEDLLKKVKQEYLSKKSAIENFNCE